MAGTCVGAVVVSLTLAAASRSPGPEAGPVRAAVPPLTTVVATTATSAPPEPVIVRPPARRP